MRLFIWGTGSKAEQTMKKKYFNEDIIVGFIDTYSKQIMFHKKPVYHPSDIKNRAYDAIYVAVENCYSVKQSCMEYDFDLNKVIFPILAEQIASCNNYKLIKDIAPRLYRELNKNRLYTLYTSEKDYLDTTSIFFKDNNLYKQDYFRYRTFEMLSNIIKERNIPGDVAECGVFQGDFAYLINKTFPDKHLHLFDTFSGFDKKEIEYELDKGTCEDEFIEYFKNTSANKVFNRMMHKENVRIYAGKFPNTALNTEVEDKKFCFVSIDFDFEESTYQGLRFFYPRLSRGGYIMLHDYNSEHLSGVKKAVQKFEAENDIKLSCVPIADHYGSLIITK